MPGSNMFLTNNLKHNNIVKVNEIIKNHNIEAYKTQSNSFNRVVVRDDIIFDSKKRINKDSGQNSNKSFPPNKI